MAEQITKELVADLFVMLYTKQAAKYGGETTLNELRVIAACYQAFTHERSASITTLSEELNIPTSTVHRAVTNLMSKGWIVDKPDLSDGRKRIISLSEQGVSGGLWRVIADWIEGYPESKQA